MQYMKKYHTTEKKIAEIKQCIKLSMLYDQIKQY